ncbi:hypothetical protein HHL22_01100 [Hymenobacter sp. RP-2-7]|uniref:Uncharacterized protein n=1 Tax=Hymenobacter polaris TaxID=2682546 RepID=A0A7Y0AAI3_9BACT|nr:hypothetical protein [Hymenobacter polaris]NML63791.1 hypothetical protein [Hymenobacter polaris]
MSFRGFLLSLLLLAGAVLLVFLGLQWLHVGTGRLVDWVAGVAILWWFAVVLILPWNAHFAALDVVEQARDAAAQGIAVPADTVAYAQRVARRFRQLAVGLHLATAAVLLGLAYFGLVPLGYWAAGIALALTLVRPAERAYEHLATRLRNMGQQIRYPREDVAELRTRVTELETGQKTLAAQLDVDREGSWASLQGQSLAALRQAIDRTDGRLEELSRQNARDHEALTRQTVTEIARLSEDARFLNQVRELIRFWKDA